MTGSPNIFLEIGYPEVARISLWAPARAARRAPGGKNAKKREKSPFLGSGPGGADDLWFHTG